MRRRDYKGFPRLERNPVKYLTDDFCLLLAAAHSHSHGGDKKSPGHGDEHDHDHEKEHRLKHSHNHSHSHDETTTVLAGAIDKVTGNIVEALSKALTSSTATPSTTTLQQDVVNVNDSSLHSYS